MKIKERINKWWKQAKKINWKVQFKNWIETLRHDRKKAIITFLIALAIISLIVFMTLNSGDKIQFQRYTVSRGDVVETLDVVGSVRAVPSAILNWKTDGIVSDFTIKIGDKVNEGDVMISLTDSSLSSTILQAQSDLLEAQVELQKVIHADSLVYDALLALNEAEYAYIVKKQMTDFWNFNNVSEEKINVARAEYQQSEEDLWNAQRTYKALADLDDDDPKKTAAEEAVDAARLANNKALRNINYLLGRSFSYEVEYDFIEYDQAVAQLEQARIDYERYKDNSDEIAAAEANVQALQNTEDQSKIIAPFDGTVTDIQAAAGEYVSSGSEAVQLDTMDNLIIDVNVSEADINKISIGQEVIITFDAIPNQEYKGKVIEVSQAGVESNSLVQFRVSIKVTNPDQSIKTGFTAVASIVINKVENALLIPNMAIQTGGGQSFVLIAGSNGSSTITPIEPGASSDSFTALVNGEINEGDVVLIPISTSTTGSEGGMFMFGGMRAITGGGGRPQEGEPPQRPED
jgi:HlyD family secretion protein